MFQFILVNILFLSLAGILYLVARTLPRIDDNSLENSLKSESLEKAIFSDWPHKIDLTLNFYIGKFFRKLKILVLRLDNYLTYKLKSMNLNGDDKKINFNDLNKSLTEKAEKTVNNNLLDENN
ncbi:MAG: hypothetical protein ACPL3E_00015 [Minisyncoccia bacterium]